MAKTKPDPFFARPDGSRAKSAWLTKLQAAAQEIAEKAKARSPGDAFLPENSLEVNRDYIAREYRRSIKDSERPAAWECLLQWHGEAALPDLESQIDNKEALKLIASLQSDASQAMLYRHLDMTEVREVVADNTKKWPLHTLRGLLAQNPSRDQPAAHLLQRLLYEHPEWLAALQSALDAEGDEAQTKTLTRLLTPAEQVTEASIDELPALLREPPWRAGTARTELPVLSLTPRREPAVVDWSRWQGGTVEPRPQIRNDLWHQIRSIHFDDDPGPLREFLNAEGLTQTAAWQQFQEEHARGGYPHFFVGGMQEGAQFLAAALRFLHSTGRLTDGDLEALNKRDDLRCQVEGRAASMLCLRGTYYDVEEHFHRLQSAAPATAEASKALRLEAETKWGPCGQVLFLWGVKPERIPAVLAANIATPGDLREPPGATRGILNYLGYLDDALALSLLRQQQPGAHAARYHYEYVGNPDTCCSPEARLLKRFGAEHIDAVFAVMPTANTQAAQTIMDIVDWDGLALHLSQYGYTARSQLRGFVRRWLLEHPRTTARALIPAAFSGDPAAAAHARHHLYLLTQEGYGDTLTAEAKAYGSEAQAAVEQLLATPPEALLPAQLPKLPAWLVLPRLPRLLLAENGRAVPLANLPDALMPLALSKGGVAYAGLGKLQASVTAASLARLMLGLFEQWLDNDMPTKDRWILELQGRLGDDANARALAPRIREWRSHLDRVRSYEGLEMLAQIGSDTALMLLSTFAEQKRYSDLQGRAAKALERVAEERGLTRDQLADRIVPLLGLEPNGQCTLDFGPRQFVLGLSTDLAPRLTDTSGKALKDLPKPNAQDNATQAKAASDFFKDFKKQIKTISSTQPPRLENAMCEQRRWLAGEFLPFFVQHPVMRHFAQRLLWAVFNPDGTWQSGFHVAEDASLSDIHDTAFTLPQIAGEQALIGLPHPLAMPSEAREKWQALFADYEILQPFEQMGRQTFALSAEESASSDLPRYAGRKVGTGSLLGLENRGWKRQAGDGGQIECFDKRLTDNLSVSLLIDDGWFIAGPPPSNESHHISAVRLLRPNGAAAGTPSPRFADLPAIMVSEVLRDLEKMAWHTRD